jgi:hypothetical protein
MSLWVETKGITEGFSSNFSQLPGFGGRVKYAV